MIAVSRFLRGARGSVAIITAFFAPLIVSAVGGTTDMTRHMTVIQSTQDALDFAVLGTIVHAGKDGMEQADIEKSIETFLDANFARRPIPFEYSIVDVSFDDGQLTVTIQVDTDMLFGRFIGFPVSSTTIVSGARLGPSAGPQDHDVMMVIDNTYSMQYGDLTRLRDAANGLVDYLSQDATDSETKTRMGIVPFARYVNVKTFEDAARPFIEFDSARRDDPAAEWLGCVHPYYDERDGEIALPEDDLVEAGYEFDIDGDRAKCRISPITPMTADGEVLKTALARIVSQSGGSTYIPTGLSWGRRMMRPDNAFAPHDVNEAAQKTLVLFSDGANALYWVRGNAESDAQTTEMCNAIKADGTRIIVAAFALDEGDARDAEALGILAACASKPEYLVEIENKDGLKDAFGELGRKIVERKSRPMLSL